MLLGRLARLQGHHQHPTALLLARTAYFHSSAAWRGKVLRTFKLADIGEGITECEVIRWYVVSPCEILDK